MTPIMSPNTPPVKRASPKLETKDLAPTESKIAGIPMPTPVKIEPPRSRIPTSEPSKIRANRKLAPKAAAAPYEPPVIPAFNIATIATSLKAPTP